MNKTQLVAGVVMALFLGLGRAEAAEGMASYYTAQSCRSERNSGTWTASGERFDESAMTCALRRRDWGGEYLIYAPDTGKEVVVRHVDFGPGKGPSSRGVIIDLTPAAFEALGFTRKQGLGRVMVQKIQ